jgi:hypothetical protein
VVGVCGSVVTDQKVGVGVSGMGIVPQGTKPASAVTTVQMAVSSDWVSDGVEFDGSWFALSGVEVAVWPPTFQLTPSNSFNFGRVLISVTPAA